MIRAIGERFETGLDWEEITNVQRAMRLAERGLPSWNDCRTRCDVEHRCRQLDVLYASMACEGYKTHEQLYREDEAGDCSPYVRPLGGFLVPDELRVGIDRDGQVIRVVNGRHRVAIARLLVIDRVPAIVQLRHAGCHRPLTEFPGVEARSTWGTDGFIEPGSRRGTEDRTVRRSLTKPRARSEA